MIRFQLQTNTLAPALNQKDGIGIAVHNGEVFAAGGWQLNGTRHNIVSRSTDGYTFVPSAQPASFPPTHATPLVVIRGRLTSFGGDQNGGDYHDHIHSWSMDEGDAWIDHGSFSALRRVGHLAFVAVIDGLEYGVIIGGQTISAFSGTPTKQFNDILLWDGTTLTTLYEDAPYQMRGYLSSLAVSPTGEVIFPGGGNYETADLARGYRTDSVKFMPDMSWRLPNQKGYSSLPPVLYPNATYWNGCWRFGGHNTSLGGDIKTLHFSTDLKTWTEVPNPIGPRHAAVMFTFDDAIYIGTGANANGCEMWRIKDFDPALVHVNTWPGSGTTGMAATYTVLDSAPVPNGKTVEHISLNFSGSRGVRTKVFRNNGGTMECVHAGSWFTHPGNGVVDFPCHYTIPNDGYEYFIGFAFALSGQVDRYCYSIPTGRYMCAGDITGNAAFTYYSDGNFAMGWIE